MVYLNIVIGMILAGIHNPQPAASVTTYTYRIVNTYPHDSYAYTQGLIYEEGYLYESTGLRGQSTLRKVDLNTGSVIQHHQLTSEYFAEGITMLGNKIFQLTWQSNTGFVYDKKSFMVIDEFYYATTGWGITTDGMYLIMSDGSANLYFLDAVTYEIIRQFEVQDQNGAVSGLNELEYIKGEVFANIYPTNRIVRINARDGRVAAWIDLSGLMRKKGVDVLNGIAYDSELDRLFVTGKLWPKLFEIELIPKE
jgi:glutamine cyclotransferase